MFLASIFLAALALPYLLVSARNVKFTNRCNEDIWISPLTNAEGPELPPGIKQVGAGSDFTYEIPDDGWAGRFWPKMGCDGSGHNCRVGQSMAPCLPTGCDPPGETKVEFNFKPTSSGESIWYDISLVDGYSVATEIIPSNIGGSCTHTTCSLALDKCPSESDVGDLKFNKDGQVVMCLSPCKKWNYPPPAGMGRNENEGNGLWYCCPDPVTPEDCRKGIVIDTNYVKLVHQDCPTAYAYSYDDEFALHVCDNGVSFEVNFC